MRPEDYERGRPAWCPGCGNFAVFEALKRAFAGLGLRPEEIVVVCGIGCASFIWSYLNTNALKGIHGRVLPAATGIKLANPELKVVGVSGDGDAYSIGGNHLIHAARRNVEITYLVVDNGVFGNTRGQPSPTTPRGAAAKTAPEGWPERALNPLMLMVAVGATYVAQGFSGDLRDLEALIRGALEHKGFSFINIVSPCPTFNPSRSMRWLRERAVKVEELGHNPADKGEALRLLSSLSESQIPVGLIFRGEGEPYSGLVKRGAEPENPVEEVERLMREVLEGCAETH